MPVTIIEGMRHEAEGMTPQRADLRRFEALLSAVRDHEARTRSGARTSRPRDERLYRQVREICREAGGSRRWVN